MKKRSTKPKYLNIIAFIFVALLVSVFSSPQAMANGTSLLWLNPVSANVSLSENTDVVLQLDDITSVYGLQVSLSFDPSIVSVVDADGGKPGVQISPGSCPQPDFLNRTSLLKMALIMSPAL